MTDRGPGHEGKDDVMGDAETTESIIYTCWNKPAHVWVSKVNYHGVEMYSQGQTETAARAALPVVLTALTAAYPTVLAPRP